MELTKNGPNNVSAETADLDTAKCFYLIWNYPHFTKDLRNLVAFTNMEEFSN